MTDETGSITSSYDEIRHALSDEIRHTIKRNEHAEFWERALIYVLINFVPHRRLELSEIPFNNTIDKLEEDQNFHSHIDYENDLYTAFIGTNAECGLGHKEQSD